MLRFCVEIDFFLLLFKNKMRINNIFYTKTFFKHVSVKWAVMNNCAKFILFSYFIMEGNGCFMNNSKVPCDCHWGVKCDLNMNAEYSLKTA